MSIRYELLKQILIDQHQVDLPSEYFERTILTKLEELKENSQILVITGIRRCGKSTVMQHLRNENKESDYFINFDDDRLVPFELSDFQMLLELFIELFGVQRTFYFDEIQNIPEWERFVRRLHDQKNKVFITGSNAALFSRELGTRLTGRHIQVEMFPYSFKEFAQHFHPEVIITKRHTTEQRGLLQKLFAEYIKIGGIPQYVHGGQKEYLHFLYESLLYRDIVSRYHLNDERGIKELVYYLASNIGKEFSFNKLAKLLGFSSATTISNYCSYLESCYFCFFVSRYSPSLKKQILYNKKCYFIDHALAYQVGFHFSEERGRLLENIIFLELKRRGFEVYFHKERKECDFVIKQQNKIVLAIQVCTDLDSLEVRERELAGLLDALKAYSLSSGLILTEKTEEIIKVNEGELEYHIQILPVWKWLTVPIQP